MQGRAIYANNCAACPGESLQGQPNWRDRMPNGRLPAPPHDKTGHTWHHPDAMLVNMVKNGLVPGKTVPPGYVSDMPASGDPQRSRDHCGTGLHQEQLAAQGPGGTEGRHIATTELSCPSVVFIYTMSHSRFTFSLEQVS